MTVIERLKAKKEELANKHGGLSYSSIPKTILENKINILDKLIDAYSSTTSPISLTTAQQILDQQIGFEEQKRKILERLEIAEYWEPRGVKKSPFVLCLVGPSGVGKTTFAQIAAQALGKKFFSISLEGLSDISTLTGSETNSLANNMGQLAQALAETKTHDPVILLDEIDKTGSALKNCLLGVLDTKKNQEVLDYYLDVKLDFSQAIFVITANDLKKIIDDEPLRRRMLVINLPPYTDEQKREIANLIIQKWFDQNARLNRNNFTITSEALETLIHKTKEEGVRQLERNLVSIFDYCFLQWGREAKQGKTESRIKIDSDLIHKIIPHDFFNAGLKDNSENKNDKKELEFLRRELERLKGEKNSQYELKAIKFNSLLVLRQVRGYFAEKEYLDYEGRINTAPSREEIEIIEKEFLLKVKQKNTSPKPVRENKDKKEKDKLAEIERQNKILAGQLQLNNDEMEKLKREIQNLQKQEDKDKTLSIVVITILIIWGVYRILKLLTFFRKQKKSN